MLLFSLFQHSRQLSTKRWNFTQQNLIFFYENYTKTNNILTKHTTTAAAHSINSRNNNNNNNKKNNTTTTTIRNNKSVQINKAFIYKSLIWINLFIITSETNNRRKQWFSTDVCKSVKTANKYIEHKKNNCKRIYPKYQQCSNNNCVCVHVEQWNEINK